MIHTYIYETTLTINKVVIIIINNINIILKLCSKFIKVFKRIKQNTCEVYSASVIEVSRNNVLWCESKVRYFYVCFKLSVYFFRLILFFFGFLNNELFLKCLNEYTYKKESWYITRFTINKA